ncbi:MAG: hypothetical protein JW778_05635 [Candidatus Altiarchaeota archaeon]|nr:hypothetical protein [Candidatus Altiarchaeota archaeon]
MRDNIADFEGLAEHVEKSGLNYREAILDFYKNLGEKSGFTVRRDSSIIRYGLNLGRMDLIWIEPNITFTIEFGSLDEILKHLWRILEFSPSLAVLLLSSKSGCKATDVLKLINSSPLLEPMKKKFLILDLTEEEIVE